VGFGGKSEEKESGTFEAVSQKENRRREGGVGDGVEAALCSTERASSLSLLDAAEIEGGPDRCSSNRTPVRLFFEGVEEEEVEERPSSRSWLNS